MQRELDFVDLLPVPEVVELWGAHPLVVWDDAVKQGREVSPVTKGAGPIPPVLAVDGWEACDEAHVERREAREYVVHLSRGAEEVQSLGIAAPSAFVARLRAQWMLVDGEPAGVWSVDRVERLQ